MLTGIEGEGRAGAGIRGEICTLGREIAAGAEVTGRIGSAAILVGMKAAKEGVERARAARTFMGLMRFIVVTLWVKTWYRTSQGRFEEGGQDGVLTRINGTFGPTSWVRSSQVSRVPPSIAQPRIRIPATVNCAAILRSVFHRSKRTP